MAVMKMIETKYRALSDRLNEATLRVWLATNILTQGGKLVHSEISDICGKYVIHYEHLLAG